MHIKIAMILAAGRGERLRPFTDHTPKALYPIDNRLLAKFTAESEPTQQANKSLLEYHLRKLDSAGIERVVINHAHLGGKIRQHVESLQAIQAFNFEIIYSPEPPGALETGGGIVNALRLLNDQAFITINADIYTNYPLQQLTLPVSSLVHLVLIPAPNGFDSGDFGLTSNNRVQNQQKDYLFSGIACYHPKFFTNMPYGRYSITPYLRQCATHNNATGEIYTGVWFDILDFVLP